MEFENDSPVNLLEEVSEEEVNLLSPREAQRD
jgi:hypothetical protein